ncbi:hypothetical protein [Dinoroseobacter sp. S76]|uniref:hypothetical protein n=1 Tax=Dinoroseobacter sp. S76 TaxID=3415124 RepID=UPI003C7DD39F
MLSNKSLPVLLALVLSVAMPTLTPDTAEARPGAMAAKGAFKSAAGGAKANRSVMRPKAIKPGPVAPKVKPTRPGLPAARPKPPGGKPGIKPGLPKKPPLPPRAGGKPPSVRKDFNKASKPPPRKPLKDDFNRVAKPPAKPVKGDPPPTTTPRPKGPTFKPPGI